VEEGFQRAWSAIASWESTLSEWRPESLTARMNRGQSVELPPAASACLERSEELRIATDGAFSLVWGGGTLLHGPGDRWRVEGGRIDLGGVLKGFLVDRAVEALRPWKNFVVDAAGDIYAAGAAGDGRRGWPVAVIDEQGAALATIRLRDEALSTSGGGRQPGHIVDARTGTVASCLRTVAVIAPTAAEADRTATAVFASCGAYMPAGLPTLILPSGGDPWSTSPQFRGVNRRSPS
jgi:thiamine biosynthesis lipoprotein